MLGPARLSRQRGLGARSSACRAADLGRRARWLSAVVLDFVPLFDVLGLRLLVRARPGGGRWPRSTSGTARWRAGARAAPGRSGPARRTSAGWDLPAACSARRGRSALALLVLPLLLSLANALRVRNCNLARRVWPSSCCCRWRRSLYAAPRGRARRALAARRRGRVLAFAIPVVSLVWTLRPPVPRAAGVCVRSVRRLLPGADLRRGAAPARCAGLTSGSPTWSGSRPRSRSRSPPPGAASIRGAGGAGRWPRALPLVAGVDRVVRDGRQLGFRIARADLRAGARPDADDRPLRAALRARRREDAAPSWRWPPRISSSATTSCARPWASSRSCRSRSGSSPAPTSRRRWSAPAARCTRRPWTRRSSCRRTRFPSRRAAARDGARVRGHVRRSAVRDRRWRGGWRGFLPLPMLASGLVEGIAEAADASDPDGDATIHEEARR